MVGNFIFVRLKPLLIENIKLKLSTKVQRCLSSPNKSKIALQMLLVIASAPVVQKNPCCAFTYVDKSSC